MLNCDNVKLCREGGLVYFYYVYNKIQLTASVSQFSVERQQSLNSFPCLGTVERMTRGNMEQAILSV